MKRRVLVAMLAGVAMVGAAGVGGMESQRAFAAPEPSLAPVSWELTFRHHPLERISVNIDGKDKFFWYMRYTVVNNSGRDVLFTPTFELMAETGTVAPAFKDVPDAVFTKIKELYKNPLLESPTNIYGKLLQGEDNAKDGVVIFPDIDPDARNFKLFVGGLSGETATVKNPMDETKSVILAKTLELDFNIPGQSIGIDPHPVEQPSKFIMK